MGVKGDTQWLETALGLLSEQDRVQGKSQEWQGHKHADVPLS